MDKNPHEETRQGRYFFTEDELQELKDSQSPMNVSIGKLEREIEDHKREIKGRDAKVKGLRQQLLETATKIENGHEFRPVDCIRFKSHKSKEWICGNRKTLEIVVREDFEKGDEQRAIAELICRLTTAQTFWKQCRNLINTFFQEITTEILCLTL